MKKDKDKLNFIMQRYINPAFILTLCKSIMKSKLSATQL